MTTVYDGFDDGTVYVSFVYHRVDYAWFAMLLL